MNQAETQLAVRGLDVTVAGRTLVARLSLTINAGQTTVVLGCNGSGKTLCMLSLAGLRGGSAAAVLLGGATLDALSRREVARRLSFMPQDSGTEVVGTVLDFVTLGLYPWQGGGAELFGLHLAVEFIAFLMFRRFAVGEQFRQDESIQLFFHQRIGKHILFHPAAVGAGDAGEVQKDRFVFGLRFLHRRVVAFDPGVRRRAI